MKYKKVIHGRFNKRVNRFIAEVFINGVKERVHIKNTGRLDELLRPNIEVLLEKSDNPKRKTKYSLIAVNKNSRWINIDSQAPHTVIYETLKTGALPEFANVRYVKREVMYRDSRFDLYVETDDKRGFIEVKGVTLAKNGIAMFPDAPTTRGVKHVLELIEAMREGYSAAVVFIVQMKGCWAFTPHAEIDQKFSNTLWDASQQGVKILAYDTIVKADELRLNKALPVYLP